MLATHCVARSLRYLEDTIFANSANSSNVPVAAPGDLALPVLIVEPNYWYEGGMVALEVAREGAAIVAA